MKFKQQLPINLSTQNGPVSARSDGLSALPHLFPSRPPGISKLPPYLSPATLGCVFEIVLACAKTNRPNYGFPAPALRTYDDPGRVQIVTTSARRHAVHGLQRSAA